MRMPYWLWVLLALARVVRAEATEMSVVLTTTGHVHDATLVAAQACLKSMLLTAGARWVGSSAEPQVEGEPGEVRITFRVLYSTGDPDPVAMVAGALSLHKFLTTHKGARALS